MTPYSGSATHAAPLSGRARCVRSRARQRLATRELSRWPDSSFDCGLRNSDLRLQINHVLQSAISLWQRLCRTAAYFSHLLFGKGGEGISQWFELAFNLAGEQWRRLWRLD